MCVHVCVGRGLVFLFVQCECACVCHKVGCVCTHVCVRVRRGSRQFSTRITLRGLWNKAWASREMGGLCRTCGPGRPTNFRLHIKTVREVPTALSRASITHVPRRVDQTGGQLQCVLGVRTFLGTPHDAHWIRCIRFWCRGQNAPPPPVDPGQRWSRPSQVKTKPHRIWVGWVCCHVDSTGNLKQQEVRPSQLWRWSLGHLDGLWGAGPLVPILFSRGPEQGRDELRDSQRIHKVWGNLFLQMSGRTTRTLPREARVYWRRGIF